MSFLPLFCGTNSTNLCMGGGIKLLCCSLILMNQVESEMSNDPYFQWLSQARIVLLCSFILLKQQLKFLEVQT